MMKNIIKTLLVLLLPVSMMAQWEGGFKLGGSSYEGDLTTAVLGEFGETNFSGGLFVRKHLSEKFALQAGLNFIKLTGDDSRYSHLQDRGFKFTNQVSDIALEGQYYPFGNGFNSSKKIAIAPYVSGGIAVGIPNVDVDHNKNIGNKSASLLANIDKDLRDIEEQNSVFNLPIGGGVDFVFQSGLRLGLFGSFRYTFSDLLDGVSASGNPDADDHFHYYGLKVGFILNKNKEEKIEKEVEEILDRDGDSVVDSLDACPDVKGLIALQGCPDTDGDGISDVDDKCPDVAGVKTLMGCPDADGDGVADSEDKCPDVPGLAKFGGCKNDPNDSDGDGIPDAQDNCPTVKGSASAKGCPDSDGDGVPNAEDKCPQEAGTASLSGCPDSDGDGIADKDDRCPKTAGSSFNNGCPEIRKEDKAVLDYALQNVNFSTASATLKSSSYPVLDQVADIMRRYPDQVLYINGYTDNTGNAISNQRLSESRAQSCLIYLETKGISRSQMIATGYGEEQPRASNSTAEGRRLNRRVEFVIKPR